ncbi:MAG TPA: DUF6011 domain-containing protein [Anaerolineales bacterium]|nr:DUF6011 domain-containing protein [Anaerolineales bacterium]
MEVTARCLKCRRPLSDPESVARGMGPECAGVTGGHRKRYHSKVRSYGCSSYRAIGHGSTDIPTLFTLIEEDKQPAVEEIPNRMSGMTELRMQFPTDLVDLVLSAPAAGAIAFCVKMHSKRKKKTQGSMPPGRILQEIRRMCIDLRLMFWPGMSHQGQPVACIPYGDEDWKLENSDKVMSRKELETYLSRYGMITLANR